MSLFIQQQINGQIDYDWVMANYSFEEYGLPSFPGSPECTETLRAIDVLWKDSIQLEAIYF